MKRPGEDGAGHSQAHKKQKHDYSHPKHRDSNGHYSAPKSHPNGKHNDHNKQPHNSTKPSKQNDVQDQLPSPKSESGPVPAYVRFTVPATLPPLPPVQKESLASAPFTHKSAVTYNRSTAHEPDMTYERLEFLGDAYIELIASRLIFSHYPHLPAGTQSQLRELLVKNETLAEYSRAYGFDKKVQVGHMQAMYDNSKIKGNKGFNKVLGDVFEAYIAAVVLSDVEDGYAVAEKWLTALWAPKLVEAAKDYKHYAYNRNLSITHDEKDVDLLKVYNPTAKQDLQQRILADKVVKLSYEKYKDSVELKGDQLGQNKHFIALYLTGYGYERKLLGKGEGKNKVEAGNWAATEAMHGECKGIVEECEKKLELLKKEKKEAKK